MRIDIADVKCIGAGLVRPEGVMALDDGSLYAADGRGRCARITPDGETTYWGQLGGKPNGICIDTDGNCIVANLGNGQVQVLYPDGRHIDLLARAGGLKLPTPNFPYLDSRGRLWVSNSTQIDIQESLRHPTPDGCVVRIENGKATRVAEGLYFANGLTLDRGEEYLYVAETTRADILRYRISAEGTLGPPETFGPSPLTEMGIPDGIAFDEAQNLWVTFPARNAIGYITPEGELDIVLEDPERKRLHRPSNICFGGKNRKTAFIGSLDGSTIPCFEVPHPGMRLVHQKR